MKILFLPDLSTMKTLLRSSIFIFLVANLLSCPEAHAGLYEKFLFYPSKHLRTPLEVDGCKYQAVNFEDSSGKDLHGLFFKKSVADNGIVIVSHGNGGNMLYRCDLVPHLVADTRCSVLMYDYEGYGGSTGKPSVKGILRDGVAAFDYAVNKLGYKPEQVILYGESLGCAVTCFIGTQRKPRAMILQSGFRSLPAVARDVVRVLKIVPGAVLPVPRLNNEKILQGEHAPVLIMHGKQDELIPFSHGETMFNKASEPKTFVALEHSGHNNTYKADAETFDRGIKDFVDKLPVINQ